MHRPLHRRAIQPLDTHLTRRQFGNIAVFQIHHVARHLQQGRRIGRRVIAVLTQPEQKGRTFASHHDTTRLLVIDHRDGVSSDQAPTDTAYGGKQVRLALQGGVDQVRDAFRVGFGSEDITLRAQFSAQAFVILDDAVMHHGDTARHMRMGIVFRRRPVRCPTGVGNPGVGRTTARGSLQFSHPPDRPHPLDAPRRQQGQPSRIVTTIFQLLQALDQD